MKLERDLNTHIKNRLSNYELTGEIVWHSRLNSGHIKTYFGSHIKLCDKGTWDWVIVFRNRDNNLSLLFIEGKSDSGKLRSDQILFREKYNKKDVYFLVLVDPKELDNFMDKYAKNFVHSLPSDLKDI